jgi:16S rRNA (uracil1498-N3)-methyltransferase
MARRRFYVSDLTGDSAELSDEGARHARKVLRLAVGDAVELFDGLATVASGKITRVMGGVSIQVLDRRTVAPPSPAIDLAVALPKGSRADVLVEKASELGADRLIPLIAERSVVEARESKLQRLDRLAIESAKQCGRSHVMHIDPPIAFAELLRKVDHDVRLIADTEDDFGLRIADCGLGEKEGATSASPPSSNLQPEIRDPQLPLAVQQLPTRPRVIVLIGPEGGWTDSERLAAKNAGFQAWRLGPNVLRVETAAMAALAILRRHS